MNGKKILIVDDDEIICKTLTLKLKGEGYTVVTAREGSSAVGVVRREKPDLILLDINFPNDVGTVAWDGFNLLGWLNRINDGRIPILFITGSDPAKFEQRALAAGAVAFFHKPIDHDDLLKVIRDLLSGAPKEPSAASKELRLAANDASTAPKELTLAMKT